MRVLMTGATGLIGRELGKLLAARGDTLVCLVRDAHGARLACRFRRRASTGTTCARCRRRLWPASTRSSTWRASPSPRSAGRTRRSA